jgi:hypothetical protein
MTAVGQELNTSSFTPVLQMIIILTLSAYATDKLPAENHLADNHPADIHLDQTLAVL